MNIDKLVNKGISIIGDYDNLINIKEKTLIVVGIARGGTSMISGSLNHLGIFTGLKSGAPVFEDVHLSNAIESKNMSDTVKIIDEYNNQHDIWAFKRPSMINYLSQLHREFRNPIYLFVFKDIASIAARNNISMQAEVIKNINNAQKDYQKVIDFINNTENLNGMFLSYEKIMNNKDEFLDSIVSLIGRDTVTEEKIKKAKNFIEPNPKDYLDKSRITKGQGNIEQVNDRIISGWAFYVYTLKSPIVELVINGQVISQIQANMLRKDLLEKSMHKTGLCGFKFDLPEGTIKKTDDVVVRIIDDIHNLQFGQNAKSWFYGK